MKRELQQTGLETSQPPVVSATAGLHQGRCFLLPC